MPAHSRTRLAAAVTATAVTLTLIGSGAAAVPPTYEPGANGAGDPYFPLAGNGGIDVIHYDLDLDYTPPLPDPAPLTGELEGVATIELVPTADLSSFNLDLRDLTASQVIVDKKSAAFTQSGNELTIIPPKKMKSGKEMTVVITYSGS
jgi:hypothetical protein